MFRRAQHVNHHGRDEHDRDQCKQPFPDRLNCIFRELDTEDQGKSDARAGAPKYRRDQRVAAGLAQIRECDGNDQEGFYAFAQGYNEHLQHAGLLNSRAGRQRIRYA